MPLYVSIQILPVSCMEYEKMYTVKGLFWGFIISKTVIGSKTCYVSKKKKIEIDY